MLALSLETPTNARQHLWVLHNSIAKRLRIEPTREQLEWLVLASPFMPIVVEGNVGPWQKDAFVAEISHIHIARLLRQYTPAGLRAPPTISGTHKSTHARRSV